MPADQINQSQDQAHNPDELPTDLPKVGVKTVTLFSVGVVIVFIAMFVLGYVPHRLRIREAKEVAAQKDAPPIVDVTQVKCNQAGADLTLPADARAFQETAIYPRANGYLSKLLVDIGDHVKAGQLLAEISTPEVDAQLNESKAALLQAKANLTTSKTNFELAQSTFNRYESLAKTGAVTSQDVDEKRSMFEQARSALAAADANVAVQQAAMQRLTELQGFEKVTAPFPGVISARNFDVGALLNPSNTTPASALFHLAQVDTIRVFVSVPQSYVSVITIGQEATFESRNYPGKFFKGKVTRTAGAIDPVTRTMRVEVQCANPDDALYAGMYGTAHLPITKDVSSIIVPTSALMFQADGTKVAVVEDGKIRTQKVAVGRDFGTELEILDGLKGDEQVVTSPGQRIADGVAVTVAKKSQPVEGKTQQTAQR
jgi:RND family efflux transporter MFP subunit